MLSLKKIHLTHHDTPPPKRLSPPQPTRCCRPTPSPCGSSLPLTIAPMSNLTPIPFAMLSPPNLLATAASFLQHHLSCLPSHLNAPVPRPCRRGCAHAKPLGRLPISRTCALADTPVFTVCNFSKVVAARCQAAPPSSGDG
jgi:hypothetical protein